MELHRTHRLLITCRMCLWLKYHCWPAKTVYLRWLETLFSNDPQSTTIYVKSDSPDGCLTDIQKPLLELCFYYCAIKKYWTNTFSGSPGFCYWLQFHEFTVTNNQCKRVGVFGWWEGSKLWIWPKPRVLPYILGWDRNQPIAWSQGGGGMQKKKSR